MDAIELLKKYKWWIGGVGVAGLLIYLYNKNKSNTVNFNGWANQTGLNFADLANQIYNAENGCATDEQTVLNIYSQLKSAGDIQALTNAFGTRVLNPCWVDHPIDAMTGSGNQSMDLQTFLNANLSQNALNQIAQIQASFTQTPANDNNPFQ